MDFSFSAADEAFRARARGWLAERLDAGGPHHNVTHAQDARGGGRQLALTYIKARE